MHIRCRKIANFHTANFFAFRKFWPVYLFLKFANSSFLTKANTQNDYVSMFLFLSSSEHENYCCVKIISVTVQTSLYVISLASQTTRGHWLHSVCRRSFTVCCVICRQSCWYYSCNAHKNIQVNILQKPYIGKIRIRDIQATF